MHPSGEGAAVNKTQQQIMKSAEFQARARKWLKSNPPPADWRGTPMEWAFCEMPSVPWWMTPFFDWLKGRK